MVSLVSHMYGAFTTLEDSSLSTWVANRQTRCRRSPQWLSSMWGDGGTFKLEEAPLLGMFRYHLGVSSSSKKEWVGFPRKE
jgi:hypothetical protein